MAIFQNILNKASTQDLKTGSQDAVDWFRSQALKVKRIDNKKITQTNEPFRRMQSLSPNSIGKMYMFVYDPKMKDVLPYYDTFPLVFPIEFYGDSFLGLNMHYLPPAMRAKLMDALYLTINNEKYDKTTLLKISYQILSGASRYRYFKPCVKKYLMTHVGSPFIYIAPDEWDYALMLPTERFQKANKSVVYKDSLSMV
jgi:hypothetical protein